jgi:hypothetical protein
LLLSIVANEIEDTIIIEMAAENPPRKPKLLESIIKKLRISQRIVSAA